MSGEELPCCGGVLANIVVDQGTLVCGACNKIYAPTTVAFRGAIRSLAIEEVARVVECMAHNANGPVFAKHIRNLI